MEIVNHDCRYLRDFGPLSFRQMALTKRRSIVLRICEFVILTGFSYLITFRTRGEQLAPQIRHKDVQDKGQWDITDQSNQRGGVLEAQQRCFSYRAILVAIVSQNYFVLVFVGYRTIIRATRCKMGITQMCLCETKYQGGGYRTILGSC